MKHFFVIFISSFFCFSISAQNTVYVKPDAADSTTEDGSLEFPYNDIAKAVRRVERKGGGDVIVVDGTYDMTNKEVTIATAATPTTSVTIKPQTTAGVTLNFNGRSGFIFKDAARYITLEGFDINGQTDKIDYWPIVAKAFWGDNSIPLQGGLAVILDGQHITIKDNYIHNWYQKAVEIRNGRYVNVVGNIIQKIATTSLSGGHGIMRQQKGIEFTDDDVKDVYRWDLRENMVFNVQQTIYSWVPSKGFIEMVIDEGKSILIDDPKDKDGKQELMTARIKNNIVAFGSVDHIRLKSTPNLEVSHNSIYSEGVNADGISDKQGDTITIKFTNFKCHNNAAQTMATVSAIEIDKAVEETIDREGTPDVSGNYAMDGRIKPNRQSGITQLLDEELFVSPNTGNFRINPLLNLPSVPGVENAVLDKLDQKIKDFKITVTPNNFQVDHLKLTQTILDNIPGLNDGLLNNESVFTDNGIMSANYHTITFTVVNGDWKTDTKSPATQNFELNPVYYKWYSTIAATYKNAIGEDYERIRWGDSEVMQNQVFDENWLTVSQIKSDSNTLINGYDNNFVLDGDILIEFEDFTPAIGDEFDLISARSITTNNTDDLFDQIVFKGFTPKNYTLEIVDVANGQVVRLTIDAILSTDTIEHHKQKLKVTPNPASAFFTIFVDAPIDQVKFYDLLGKKVNIQSKATPSNQGYLFSTEGIDPGMYIIKVENNTIKVVID